jgi:hypothetical protein
MAEALPPEVARLASFERALEGTINITQEDIDEEPSFEGSPLSNCWNSLRRKGFTCTESVEDFAGKPKRMRMFHLKGGTS